MPNHKSQPNPTPNTPVRLSQIWGLLKTVTTKPSYIPKTFSEQLVIWDDTAGSGDILMCIYDTKGKAWMGVTITSI